MLKKTFCLFVVFAHLGILTGQEESQKFRIWPDGAPEEKSKPYNPELYLYQAKKQSSDSFILIFPGGGYHALAHQHEGTDIAAYFGRKGITTAVLRYRVPRRKGAPKHMMAWQDAQRAIRIVRSKAKEWNINPEKIGVLGFSAGGHLTLMMATTSKTPAYAPIDKIDELSPHVNFAIPVYPAYVLQDGANGANKDKGNASQLVEDFQFDSNTPPMCLIHGDEDQYSAMGSVAIYHKLRTLNIPAELHIFAKVGHGFGANPTKNPNNQHIGNWLNQAYEAIKVFGY